jgi:hypothetical protein
MPQVSAAPALPARRWYGWQLVASDLTFVTIGSLARRGQGATVATAGLALGAPLLHVANGDWKAAIGSAIMRGTLIAIAWRLGGTWAWRDSTPPCTGVPELCDDGNVIGDAESGLAKLFGLALLGTFIAIDDGIFSRTGDSSAAVAPVRSHNFAPTLAPTSGGLAMGLVGTF